jgi:hypothetical protein
MRRRRRRASNRSVEWASQHTYVRTHTSVRAHAHMHTHTRIDTRTRTRAHAAELDPRACGGAGLPAAAHSAPAGGGAARHPAAHRVPGPHAPRRAGARAVGRWPARASMVVMKRSRSVSRAASLPIRASVTSQHDAGDVAACHGATGPATCREHGRCRRRRVQSAGPGRGVRCVRRRDGRCWCGGWGGGGCGGRGRRCGARSRPCGRRSGGRARRTGGPGPGPSWCSGGPW